MRVLIDTTFAARGPSGTGVYVERLAAALREAEGVDVVEATNAQRRPPAGGGIGSLRNLAADRRWSAAHAAAAARARPAPTSCTTRCPRTPHAPCPAGDHRPRPRVRAAPPSSSTRGFGAYARRAHRHAARRAAAVVCVSQATADDVMELWGVPAERIVVAHHGPGQDLPAIELRASRALPLRRRRRAAQEPRAAARGARQVPRLRGAVAAARRRRLARPPGRGRGRRTPDASASRSCYAGALALVHPGAARGLRPDAARGDARRRPGRRRRAPPRVMRGLRRRGAATSTRATPDALAAELAALRGRPRAARRADRSRGRERAAAFTLGALGARAREAYTLAHMSAPSHRPMKIAILGTRGIPASYSRLRDRRRAARQPPHRSAATRSSSTAARTSSTAAARVQGRAARAPADGPQQVPRHVRAHAAVARCTPRAA